MIRVIHTGNKPLMIGMNHAKRIARAHDRRDQLAVLAVMGPGYPRQHQHHRDLVKQRHAYYADVYEGEQRDLDNRANYTIAAFDDARQRHQDVGDYVGAVSEPAGGTTVV